jgi:geranylgeranyl diphosphate synthase, type II
MDLIAHLRAERELVDAALDRLLPPATNWPTRLHEAMRYAVFGGGKRIRPILARAACRAAGADPEPVLEAACALEMIHTYSLVHDDLPALDNDGLRRGRATVHVAYDEALAILVGDALLTQGFLVLARYPEGTELGARRAAAGHLLASAVGSQGMVGGQVEDLEAEGAAPDAARLERIHNAKTGALLAASLELGALWAGVAESHRAAFATFGRKLGLLFQIADDILDVTGTAAELGKSPGKDMSTGKLTYPLVFGFDKAVAVRDRLAGELGHEAAELEGPDGVLAALVDYIASRDR